jgi:Mce-associated membrane protein
MTGAPEPDVEPSVEPDVEPSVEPDVHEVPDAPAGQARGGGWLLPVLAAVVAAVLLAAAVLGWRVLEQRAAESARVEALAAARSAVVEVLSYDYRRMQRDIDAATELATGEFLEEYRAATAGLVEQAEEGEVVVTATVLTAAVQSAERDEVEVLLFVDQSTSRAGLEQPRVDQNRLRVVLEDVDGRWRIARLEAV